jgi:purine-nucleoside phosphorylase
MIDPRIPHARQLALDASKIAEAAGGDIDVAIVLGSGLSAVFGVDANLSEIPYGSLLGMPVAPLVGHTGAALVGTIHGKRVVAFAGRVHLYQGFSAQQVTVNVRLAHAAGAKTFIVTNAAGALNPAYAAGDLMLISDHINLTGTNPLIGVPLENPFVDMMHAYDPHFRSLARDVAGDDQTVREGVYAGLLGPNYETPAEARYLRGIGADAVGMSTVLETILARSMGMKVLGISLITNMVGAPETTHSEVTTIAGSAGPRLAKLIDGVIAGM